MLFAKLCDDEFNKNTCGQTYFHCNIVYVEQFCVKWHKTCFKMLGLLGDSKKFG